MKKTVVTSENMNAIINHQKKQIEKVTKDLTEKNNSYIQAVWGGLRILEFEYKQEIERLTIKNNELKEENERLKNK
jgi:hypothetical protein